MFFLYISWIDIWKIKSKTRALEVVLLKHKHVEVLCYQNK